MNEAPRERGQGYQKKRLTKPKRRNQFVTSLCQQNNMVLDSHKTHRSIFTVFVVARIHLQKTIEIKDRLPDTPICYLFTRCDTEP